MLSGRYPCSISVSLIAAAFTRTQSAMRQTCFCSLTLPGSENVAAIADGGNNDGDTGELGGGYCEKFG